MKTQSLPSTFKVGILAAAIASTAACAPNNNTTRTVSIHSSATTAAARAEDIALAGEQLMSAKSFVYADTAFHLALEHDPKNARAGFYSKLLAPVMKLRGIATRARPLMTKEERERQDQSLAQYPDSAIRMFLTDGREDIRSEKEIQELLDQVIEGFDSFREHLKATKTQTLTLNVPAVVYSEQIRKVSESCAVKRVTEGSYELTNCDFNFRLRIDVNRADKEVLQQIVSGYQIFLSVANAYRMDGILGEKKKLNEKLVSAKGSEIQAYLMSQPNWGVLRESKYLTSVLSMGRDAVTGVRWLQANQTENCPKGETVKGQRAGNLFEDGLCVDSTTKVTKAIHLAEKILSGEIFQTEKVAVRPAALFENPIRDLKSQLPIEADKCGRVLSAADPTLGGLFPNGDVEKAVDSQCEAGIEE
ncbi:MAG: hypothetical protein NDI61_00750 [Bdellovibrionaceae bacterium]|nr:hypothetical protein [Pseudobdellovibrionaceae bacterium]